MNLSTRNGGIGGIVAGLAYLVRAVIEFIQPQLYVGFVSIWDYANETVSAIALFATIFGLIGFHSFAQNRYGRGGAVGFWLTTIGTSLMAVSSIASLYAGKSILAVAGIGGVLLSLIGYLTLGMMAIRGKVLSVWGRLAFGLAWLGVGSCN